MSGEQGDDVWGDEDFLNALIQATEDASASAAASSSSGGGAPSLPLSRDRHPPPDPIPPSSSRNPLPPATAAAVSSLPPPPPVHVVPGAPTPVPLAYNGTRAAWQEWDDPFAAGNLVAFAFDGGVDHREYDFSPPRELSQREKRTESSSAAEERGSTRTGGAKNVGRSRSSAGGVKVEKEKDKEMGRLKRELERVLKKLDRLEHEHHELQKDKSKKDKELECAFSEILARDAELESLKKEKLLPSKQSHSQASLEPHCARISVDQDVQFPISEDKGAQSLPCFVENATKKLSSISIEPAAPSRDPPLDFCLPETCVKKRKNLQSDEPSAVSELKCRAINDVGLSTSNGCLIQSELPAEKNVGLHHVKAIGIQTELDSSHPGIEDGSFLHDISSKLLSIWGSPTERISGQHLISRLFVSCSADLYVLFRFIGIPSNINMDLLADKKSFDAALHGSLHSVPSTEAQKISRLYSVMMKMRNEMAQLHDLLDVLIELCVLKDVIIIHRSLCILRAVLQTVCFRGSYKRDNIVITQTHDNMFQEGEKGIKAVNVGMEFQETENACDIGKTSIALPSGSFSLQNPWNNEYGSSSNGPSLSLSCRILLFETMHKIVVNNTNANIQVEAISVMNLILLRSDPISERGKLGLTASFTIVSHMLRKEVDPRMKRQAVKLLFLLLNCPKLLRLFCTGCHDDNGHAKAADGQDENSRLHDLISTIPRGLADCVADGGNSIQELILCKEAIILLAFIASSGKSGFEILLSPTKRGNFLELLVQVLASQMDMQAGGLGESQDLHKERTALIREALILLNRLASNAVYSKPTLGGLTHSTTMAALTVDAVNRICHTMSSYCKHDNTKKAQMEAEIFDLARLFRTRILSFLGENSS